MSKTKNSSIRFDDDQLTFFKLNNPGIKTPQQIVDYLMSQYWFKHDGDVWIIGKNNEPSGIVKACPVITQKPVLQNNEKPVLQNPIFKDGVDVLENRQPDNSIVNFSQPISNPATEKYNSFMEEIKAAPSPKHVEAIAFIIKADKVLSSLQKQTLERFAIEHSKTFDF